MRKALTAIQFGKALVYLELEIKFFYHVIHCNIIGHRPHKLNDLFLGGWHAYPPAAIGLF
jgi:hypothetical protein